MLWEGAVKYDIGEQLQGTGKVLLQEGRIHDCLLLVGEGVKVASHILHTVEDVPGTAFLGTLEEHVLHEMRPASLLGALVARAGINGISTIGHSRGRRGVYDTQSVG